MSPNRAAASFAAKGLLSGPVSESVRNLVRSADVPPEFQEEILTAVSFRMSSDLEWNRQVTSLVRNPSLLPVLQMRVAEVGNRELSLALARNERLDPDVQTVLCAHGFQSVVSELAGNPCLVPDRQRELFERSTPNDPTPTRFARDLRWMLAHNESLIPTLQLALSVDVYVSVRRALNENRGVDLEVVATKFVAEFRPRLLTDWLNTYSLAEWRPLAEESPHPFAGFLEVVAALR